MKTDTRRKLPTERCRFYPIKPGWIGLWVICLSLLIGQTYAATETDKPDGLRHEELLKKAEDILLKRTGLEARHEALKHLEDATKLVEKTPDGEFLHRKEAEYYRAWILCREPDEKAQQSGRAMFRKLSSNVWWPPDKRPLIEHASSKCGVNANAAKITSTDTWVISSDLKGTAKWSQPIRFGSRASLPRLSWDQKDQAIAALTARFGKSLSVVESKPFLVVGGRGITYLNKLSNTVLQPYYTHLREQLKVREDGAIIYVFVGSSHKDMAAMTGRLYDVASEDWMGVELAIAYSDPDSKTLMAICGKDASNCTSFAHELFHFLNSRSFVDAPWWLYEGMAELYESGNLVDGEFRAKASNWRKWNLDSKNLNEHSLRDMLVLSKNDTLLNSPPGSPVMMARARFFCQYLHEHGKLWPIYHELRNRNSLEAGMDPAGLAAIENQLKKTISVVSNNFASWLRVNVDPVLAPKHP